MSAPAPGPKGSRPRRREEVREFRAEALSLWRITFAPLVWALHFVVSYGATALVCARGGSVVALRWGIGVGTLGALVAIAVLAVMAWRQWRARGGSGWEEDAGSDADRHRFLGHAAFLLAVIAGIGVIYGALPALLIESCR